MSSIEELNRAYIMLLNNFMLPGYELFYNHEGTPMIKLSNIGPATSMEDIRRIMSENIVKATVRYERIIEELMNPIEFNYAHD